MWPKVMAQLLELLPHATRLLPMADRFFQAKSQGDEATLKAIEGLRADVGQTTAAHAGLYRQMNELGEKVEAAAAEARAARTAAVAAEAKLEKVEALLRKIGMLAGAGFALIAAIIVVLGYLVTHH
jgi:hypothetical protein